MSGRRRKAIVCPTLVGCVLLMVGCQQQMSNQPKYTPLAASDFFADGMSARPAVAGTVARGHLHVDEGYHVTREALARGRERFEIFCAPCHGRVGNGDGIVVERGFRAPPSYHTDRLRTAPVEHYFDVITNGFGAMASYASRVPVRDRWAIIAYIRALQLSQSAKIEDVPERERGRLGHE